MRYLILVVFLGLGVLVNAQKVESNGTVYKIKGEKFFENGKDITDLLTEAEKLQIQVALEGKLKKQRVVEKEEKLKKERKKSEKGLKRAEKKQKNAERDLKKKERAQDKFEKAERKYHKEQKKYQRLKDKGKLSPIAEEKLIKKIKNLNEDLERAKRKLKRS